MAERDPLFFDAEKEKKRAETFVRDLCETSDPDIYGIVKNSLDIAAPGLKEPIRDAIACSIAIKIKAVIYPDRQT